MILPACLFFLSAAALLFEVDLSRILSVSQFYHFAFMVVSLALLGYGASGTALALFPAMLQKSPRQSLVWLSLASGLSILGGYILINQAPFDSFSIAWDRRQALLLALHYLVLTMPFFFNGLAVGLLLTLTPKSAGRTYAANLLGSAAGCVLALVAPLKLGAEGVVVLSSGLAFLPAAIATLAGESNPEPATKKQKWLALLLAAAGLVFVLSDLVMRFTLGSGFPLLELHLSPYKSLSYLLQQPEARTESRQWNAFSRVDVVSSPGIHTFPGLSYRYLGALPAQQGLLVDGDDLSPILGPGANLNFTGYLPNAIAYQLRPQATALILGGRGGLEILTALTQGARRVAAVEVNPLITAVVPVYNSPAVETILSDERSFLRNTTSQYDVIVLSLNTAFHPVRSGAYSLVEDYRYTVEAFNDALERLAPGGIFVVTRWLQNPPSEDLRTFALAVTALERQGLDPKERLVALRGYQTATFLIKIQPFTAEEILAIRHFAEDRAFDLTYMPGVSPLETNRFNILPMPVYYQAYHALLAPEPRREYYQQYPYEISPPTDDRPFFGHFFKWSQSAQVLSELGKTWQPFGGAGYFIILALLALSVCLACLLILLPVVLARFRTSRPGVAAIGPERQVIKAPSPGVYVLYFALIGLAYLFVEIPLIQKFILFLGQPSYAMAAILFTLLFFSGIGSLLAERLPLQLDLALLILLLLVFPFLVPYLFQSTLGLSFWLRLSLTVLLLAPLGVLMGVPFPGGIGRLATHGFSSQIPWMWAVNGSASVISAVLAALLALTFGFTWVLRLGAICYAGAWLAIRVTRRFTVPR